MERNGRRLAVGLTLTQSSPLLARGKEGGGGGGGGDINFQEVELQS